MLSRNLNLLIVCWRALRLLLHLCYAFILAGLYPLLDTSARLQVLQRWSRNLLYILGIKLHVSGDAVSPTGRGGLIVANHISWLDIVALNALQPSRFIAKSEVGDWPLLGKLSHRIGTLFIRRDMRRDTARINQAVREILQQGEHVVLFPEGNSTTGNRPVHFHSSLLQGALGANVPILPIAVQYHDAQGRTTDTAAFVGDMSFVQSMWKILRCPRLHVTLIRMPAIECTGHNRRELAREAQASINSALPVQDIPCSTDAIMFNLTVTCASSCGNSPSLHFLQHQTGDDDAEPDTATTPAT